MTKDEIKIMAITCNNYYNCGLCPYNPEDISRFIGDRWKGGCPNYDRKIVYAMGKGYGNISEYEAEIERLRQEVRDTDKMSRNSIEQYKADYDRAFERLKSQQQEIDGLKAENARLTEKLKKETAKEILSRIKLYATDSKTDLIVLIDEIAEANGVEVEE